MPGVDDETEPPPPDPKENNNIIDNLQFFTPGSDQNFEKKWQ